MKRHVSCVAAMVCAALLGLWAAAGVRAAEPAPLDSQVAELQKAMAALQSQIADIKARQENRKAIEEVLKEMGADPMPNDLRLYWKDGIRMDSRDGNIKLKFGGRYMYDMSWIGGRDMERYGGLDLTDGFETRRGRLYVEGELWKNLKFKWEYDWSGGGSVVRDAYLEFKKLPTVGNLRLGHFKEPFSLDELTSSRFITFMERGVPNMMAPGRNGGAMIHNTLFDKRVTWAAGVFRETAAADGGQIQSDGTYNFTTRVTWLPVYEDEGRHLVHLGGAYSYRHLDAQQIRFRERPEVHIIPVRPVTTAFFDVRDANLYGAEGAVVWGPFHAEAEYIAMDMKCHEALSGFPGFHARHQPDPTFHGYYVQAGYFLTGETRPYKTSDGTFDRVKPKKPYGQGGWGAWEVAYRFSYLDTDSHRISGGKYWDQTVGLNWYLNNNVRIMWNYVHAYVDYGHEPNDRADANAITMRVQFDF